MGRLAIFRKCRVCERVLPHKAVRTTSAGPRLAETCYLCIPTKPHTQQLAEAAIAKFQGASLVPSGRNDGVFYLADKRNVKRPYQNLSAAERKERLAADEEAIRTKFIADMEAGLLPDDMLAPMKWDERSGLPHPTVGDLRRQREQAKLNAEFHEFLHKLAYPDIELDPISGPTPTPSIVPQNFPGKELGCMPTLDCLPGYVKPSPPVNVPNRPVYECSCCHDRTCDLDDAGNPWCWRCAHYVFACGRCALHNSVQFFPALAGNPEPPPLPEDEEPD